MTKIFRLWGLATFIILTALVTVFWLMFAAPLTKWTIESVGTKLAKAKVEVESVDLSFDPLIFQVNGLQVTDHTAPMINLIEIHSLEAKVELGALLRGYTNIELLSVSGAQLNTPRTASGAIELDTTIDSVEEDADNQEPSAAAKLASSIQAELPSVDEVLAKETLLTQTLAAQLEKDFAKSEKEVSQATENVPTEAKLKQYEKDINNIVNADFKSIEDFKKQKAKFEDIKKQIATDKENIQTATKAISSNTDQLSDALNQLQKAPDQDISRLMDTYGLSGDGAGNIANLIFGPQAKEWIDTGREWYTKIKPYLPEKTKESEEAQAKQVRVGEDIHFPGRPRIPRFIIRDITGDLATSERRFAILASNITTEQDITGVTSDLTLTSNKADGSAITFNGKADLMQNPAVLPFDFSMSGFSLSDHQLMSTEAWQLSLAAGNVTTNGKGQFSQGKINSNTRIQFNQAKFSGNTKQTVYKEIQNALASISTFNVDVKYNGNPLRPSIGVSSDLDKKVSGAFNEQLKRKQRAFERELRAKLETKKEELIKPYRAKLDQLKQRKAELTKQAQQLEQSAKAQLADFEAMQKQKLAAEQKRLKKEAEAKAKAEEERLKKEAEEKAKKALKDKLKGFKM